MANSLESESNIAEGDENISLNSKTVDVHPLAFTIEFNDQKVDEVRKSKVQERLTAFSLKHRRNPSLPDFGAVKNAKSSPPLEKLPSPLNSQHVPIISKGVSKCSKISETQWKSSVLKAVKNSELKSPVILRNIEVNGSRGSFLKHLKNGRRNSLNDIDSSKISSQNEMPSNLDYTSVRNGGAERNSDSENKSDTLSEAGTYTVDKEDDSPENDKNKTQVLQDNEDNDENIDENKKNFRSSWINDWVRDVEEQNMRNPALKEPSQIISRNSGSEHSSPSASKIPSPINILSRKAKLRGVKSGEVFSTKLNGSIIHRRSSSLSAKVK